MEALGQNEIGTSALPDVKLPVLLEQFVDIDCDVDKAWAFISDMENYVQWFPAIVQMQSDDDLPLRSLGKNYRETAILPGGKEEKIKVVVVAADANQRHLAIEASLQPVLPRFDYRVVATGTGQCRYYWRCCGRGQGAYAALGKVVLPFILRPRLNQALTNLKRILDAKPDENMRAARLFRFGPAKEALIFTSTAARPTPKKGEVLVRVAASSINQIDLHRRSGYGRNAMRVRGALSFPIILGNDYAGTVVAVGEGVTGLDLGARVFGAKPPSSQGSFAEYVIVAASETRPLPDDINFQTAAAIPYVFLTAWSALVGDGGLVATSGNRPKVFVQGGAGGVGSMAIVIAKQMGAYVAASCLAGQADIVREFGADEVFEAGTSSYAQALRGYDIALCAANPSEQDDMIAILGAEGRYVSVIHPTLTLTDELGLLKGFMTAKKTLKTLNARLKPDSKSAAWTLFKITPEALDAMAEWTASGKLCPKIDSTFDFSELVDAQERAESGSATGKVVVTFQAEASQLIPQT